MAINNLLLSASGICASFGLVAVFGSWLGHRRIRDGLKLGLDFWLAAGLLLLSADADWRAVGTAAVIVVIRKIVAFSVARPFANCWIRPEFRFFHR